MNLADVVAARRSIRAFTPEPVPRDAIEYAIALAVQSPAPHHSEPWRFTIVEEHEKRAALAHAMGEVWRTDLAGDGLAPDRIDEITGRSARLLTAAPALVIAGADMSGAHEYPDDRRQRAEWSLFAHSVGAALQTLMLGLADRGIASCWLSAPIFCGATVRDHLGWPAGFEPHALVMAGYASPEYRPRPRPFPDVGRYVIGD